MVSPVRVAPPAKVPGVAAWFGRPLRASYNRPTRLQRPQGAVAGLLGGGARSPSGSLRARRRAAPGAPQSAPAALRSPSRNIARASRAVARPAPCGRGDSARPAGSAAGRRACSPAQLLPLGHELLDGADGLGRIEVLGAGFGAIHDRMAAVEPERVLELIQPLPGGLVSAVNNPAVGRQ